MLNTVNMISARELVCDILPKLKATEDLISNTLHDIIKHTRSDEERNRNALLQQEFELEIMMIHMNLDHLLKRYAEAIQTVSDSDGNDADAMLELDQHERFAIKSARQLYERARTIQAGK